MKIFNTLTKKKEEFLPLEPGKVKMYACGPTVYNYFHIGNARTFMTFDVMRQYLKYRGYEVTFVQNFTDVDDKIIKKANEKGVPSLEISEKYIQAYFKDAASLGIQPADHHPKVTETIPEIIQLIQELAEKGYAYPVGGDVYFDVSKFEAYGKLSKQNLEELQCGARVDVNEQKKNPLDFALWKEAKPGEPSWESPWGFGRPGWHIECSAMVKKYLGETIDIHGGGGDLVFPHHENEIAQSEAAFGRPFANYWVHVGYLMVDDSKMSKSLNNFFTPREIAEEFDLETVRFFMLSAQYRNPINFSKELLEAAQKGLDRLYTTRDHLEHLLAHAQDIDPAEQAPWVNELADFRTKFIEAMDDDFNTADGISVIFELVRHINTHASSEAGKQSLEKALEMLLELAGVLGFLKKKEEEGLDQSLEKLIEERQQARKEKNFKRADEIRDQLKAMGILLEDTPQGVKIVRQ